ncbi:MAG: hypothetical protein HOQ32_16760 [Lysobacter sp.]|nr:hypothetical protein [Lysobacter sp.]
MAWLVAVWTMVWPGLALVSSLGLSWLLLRTIARALTRGRETRLVLRPSAAGAADTLVVAVHGMPGVVKFAGALALIAETWPEADHLVVDYHDSWLRGFISSADARAVADAIEQGIHAEFKRGQYQRVVLVGYSAGASLLRKALVWAYGEEEDRIAFGRRGKRAWVDKIERVVLLAGMNRGWSVDPRPDLMSWPTYLSIRLGEFVAGFLGIGRLISAMHRGSSFIADTRLQWVRLARSEDVVAGRQHFPQVIQLIGSEDDLVSKEDGQDLSTAAGTLFKTLAQTGHKEIGGALDDTSTPAALERRRMIALALRGRVDELEPDLVEMKEDREVDRLVYVMHGIRDLGEWTDRVRDEVRRRYEGNAERVAVFSAKYGRFPMARFLLPFDRQRNVREFMDRYTEHVARYPNAKSMDYVGHSNGTYILGSALLRYVTIRVRRVFFAGSVMPYGYPWTELVDGGRVESVVNVVATRDWVVAIFPKMFQQIADLFRLDSRQGLFDLGGAGFDGFGASGLSAAVDNLEYSRGAHSTGVDVDDQDKLAAIASYVVGGERAGLRTFESAKKKNPLLAVVSTLCVLVWLGLLVGLSLLGYLIFLWFASHGLLLAGAAVAGYALLVILLLYWI